MNISDNIKKIREEKRLSQAEISRRLNLDPSAYFRLEKRGNKLTLEQIEDIALALEVKPVELMGLSSNDEILEVKKSNEQNLEKRIAELEDRLKDKELRIETYSGIIYRTVEELKKHFEILIVDLATHSKLGILEWSIDRKRPNYLESITEETINFVNNFTSFKNNYICLGYTTNREYLEKVYNKRRDISDGSRVKTRLILDTSDMTNICSLPDSFDEIGDILLDSIVYFPDSYLNILKSVDFDWLNFVKYSFGKELKIDNKIISQIYKDKYKKESNKIIEFDSFSIVEKYPSNITSYKEIQTAVSKILQEGDS